MRKNKTSSSLVGWNQNLGEVGCHGLENVSTRKRERVREREIGGI